MNRSEAGSALLGLESVRAALDQMNPQIGEARSRALFAAVMVNLQRQRRWHPRRLLRTIGAVLAAAVDLGRGRL